jgi:hypothetical protein
MNYITEEYLTTHKLEIYDELTKSNKYPRNKNGSLPKRFWTHFKARVKELDQLLIYIH